MHIVLLEPEIPPNTGNIARLCAATRARLHLVGPLGFDLSEKHLKRAGMDYWEQVDYRVYPDFEAFLPQLDGQTFYLLTTKCRRPYWETAFQEGDWLLFGRESKGLPESLLNAHPGRRLTIPMPNPAARSLNLATSVGIVLYEALRQLGKVGGSKLEAES
jgi:tRNA (cytidine/uridine-2'-O-)-methyltransferase